MVRRRPRSPDKLAISKRVPLPTRQGNIGVVLSGGGSRAAYQVGALRALSPGLDRDESPISVVVGSSIGAINGLIFSATLKAGLTESVDVLEELWRIRTFRNTFTGSPSAAFFRAVKMAMWQYMSPGPKPTSESIFDPTPLMTQVDSVIQEYGSLHPDKRASSLHSVAVMTTIEGQERKPLLFLSSHKKISDEILHGASFEVCHIDKLTAKHGFASAALPSVLPPVELDTDDGKVRLVDGGISQNVPVDPAVRLGADKVIVIDISGRSWWLDQYQEPHDTRPDWEVPAGFDTFCLRPPDTFQIRNQNPFGPILKHAVSKSSAKFMRAVGPVWPIFKILKSRMGEDLAYEVMSYVALDPEYLQGLIEEGYNDAMKLLKNRQKIEFQQNTDYLEVAEALA